jgi:hypothetical protein
MTMGRWDCHTENTLHRHCVATISPVMEEAACTLPFSIIIRRRMNIVFALETGFETCELDALWFFRVAFRFCDLVDHT